MCGEALIATSATGETLAFCVGGGLTQSEICATHAVGWELDRLLKKRSTGSFDFRFLAVAYKEARSEYLPSRELYRVLGVSIH